MKKDIAIPILLFLAFIFIVYFLLPQYRKVVALNNSIFKEKSSFKQMEKYYSDLRKISKELDGYQSALEKINSAIPQNFSLASLINVLQTDAAESGLILKSINISAAPTAVMIKRKKKVEVQRGPKKHYFSLDLTGNFSSFKNFLETIENSSRMIEAEKISLEKTERSELEFNVLIKVYSY